MANPTKFVNFQNYFNANRQSAEAEAKRLSEQAQRQAEGAQQAQQAALRDFQSKQYQGNDVQAPPVPPTNVGPGAQTNFKGQPVLSGQPNYQPQPIPKKGPAGRRRGDDTYVPPTIQPQQPGMTNEQALAKGQEWTTAANQAPGTLSEVSDPSALYLQTQRAQQGLDALQSEGGIAASLGQTGGAGRFSSGLIGTAGRPRFALLASHFDPAGSMRAAEQAAAKAHADAVARAGTDASKLAALYPALPPVPTKAPLTGVSNTGGRTGHSDYGQRVNFGGWDGWGLN